MHCALHDGLLLEHAIAAPQGLHVRRQRVRVGAIELAQDVIEQTPSALGAALRELQITRVKEDAWQHVAPDLGGARALAIQPRTARCIAVETHFHLLWKRARGDRQPEKRTLFMRLNQVVNRRATKACERRRVVNRLKDIALALAVLAREHIEVRPQGQLQRREIAKTARVKREDAVGHRAFETGE